MPSAISMPVLWGVLIVLFLVIEGVTAGLASIWFAIGSAAGLLVSLLCGPLWLQVLVFVLVSLVTLYLTRPLAKKYINGKAEATNADRVLGMTGYVTEEINNLTASGTVRVAGKLWTARSVTSVPISPGTEVRAERIEGVKLYVVPVDGAEEADKADE